MTSRGGPSSALFRGEGSVGQDGRAHNTHTDVYTVLVCPFQGGRGHTVVHTTHTVIQPSSALVQGGGVRRCTDLYTYSTRKHGPRLSLVQGGGVRQMHGLRCNKHKQTHYSDTYTRTHMPSSVPCAGGRGPLSARTCSQDIHDGHIYIHALICPLCRGEGSAISGGYTQGSGRQSPADLPQSSGRRG